MRFVSFTMFALALAWLLAETPLGAQTRALTNDIGMEFVEIPAGEFMMGCSPGDGNCRDDERPRHRVRITNSLEMGKYEVTQAEWDAAMEENPSVILGGDRPVENVNRFEAVLIVAHVARRPWEDRWVTLTSRR